MTFATTAEGEKEKLISGGHVKELVTQRWANTLNSCCCVSSSLYPVLETSLPQSI